MTRILRGGSPKSPVVSSGVWTAMEEAAAVRARARRDADALRQDVVTETRQAREKLDAEREHVRQDAEARGYAEGKGKGHLEGLSTTLASLGEPFQQRHVRSLVPVVIDAATALLGESLDADPRRVESIVRQSLDRVRRAEAPQIEVHPDDLPLVERLAEERGANTLANPSLARGDCIVRTRLGTVDGRLATRLEILREALGRNG